MLLCKVRLPFHIPLEAIHVSFTVKIGPGSSVKLQVWLTLFNWLPALNALGGWMARGYWSRTGGRFRVWKDPSVWSSAGKRKMTSCDFSDQIYSRWIEKHWDWIPRFLDLLLCFSLRLSSLWYPLILKFLLPAVMVNMNVLRAVEVLEFRLISQSLLDCVVLFLFTCFIGSYI